MEIDLDYLCKNDLKGIMDSYDLIVVGTGFGSSFFLRKYLEKSSRDKRVLVLERGVLFPHSERLKKMRGIVSDKFKNVSITEDTFENDNPEKLWDFDPNFGGSSNCWTGCTPRFMPNDFKINSLYGVGQDWPLTYEELEPYYCEVEDIMMIGGPQETPFPKSRPYPLPPESFSSVDRLIAQHYNSLYISQPTARATIPTGKRNACCSSAVCRLCPVDSKFTIENTLSYLYEDSRVVLKYGCQVFNLVTENNRVSKVVYNENGREIEVKGDVIVLGANPIFNSHILLAAGDQNPKTGKGLCEQRGTYAYLYFKGLDNLGGSSIITANGFMMYDGAHRKEYAGCLIENFNDPFIRNEQGKWRQMAKLKFIFEDLPNDKNRVLLGDNPLTPKIEYKGHDPYVDRAMNVLEDNIRDVFSFLPVERVEMDGFFQKTEGHICSTTRMSNNPNDGVIDKHLIHHQYRNLFLVGSGAFPSIAPANPTLTLSALSLMAADVNF